MTLINNFSFNFELILRVCLPLNFVFPSALPEAAPAQDSERRTVFPFCFPEKPVLCLLIKNKQLVVCKGRPVFCFVLFKQKCKNMRW